MIIPSLLASNTKSLESSQEVAASETEIFLHSGYPGMGFFFIQLFFYFLR